MLTKAILIILCFSKTAYTILYRGNNNTTSIINLLSCLREKALSPWYFISLVDQLPFKTIKMPPCDNAPYAVFILAHESKLIFLLTSAINVWVYILIYLWARTIWSRFPQTNPVHSWSFQRPCELSSCTSYTSVCWFLLDKFCYKASTNWLACL